MNMIITYHEKKPYDTPFDAAWQFIERHEGSRPYWNSREDLVSALLKIRNGATSTKDRNTVLEFIRYVCSGDVEKIENSNATKAEEIIFEHCDDFVKKAVGTSPRLHRSNQTAIL